MYVSMYVSACFDVEVWMGVGTHLLMNGLVCDVDPLPGACVDYRYSDAADGVFASTMMRGSRTLQPAAAAAAAFA